MDINYPSKQPDLTILRKGYSLHGAKTVWPVKDHITKKISYACQHITCIRKWTTPVLLTVFWTIELVNNTNTINLRYALRTKFMETKSMYKHFVFLCINMSLILFGMRNFFHIRVKILATRRNWYTKYEVTMIPKIPLPNSTQLNAFANCSWHC